MKKSVMFSAQATVWMLVGIIFVVLSFISLYMAIPAFGGMFLAKVYQDKADSAKVHEIILDNDLYEHTY